MRFEMQFTRRYADFCLDVRLSLPGSGITALTGPSGSGKTTLLRCIAGLEHAAHGRLQVGSDTWQDAGVFLPTHRRPLGYVFQDGALFPHLSVRENLAFGQKRIAASQRRVALDEAVSLLGIGHLLDRRPGLLSGGEKQRVAIARALAVSPQVLLMDEPLAALDKKRRQEIFPYLENLHRELAIPVLYVTHAHEEIARLAHHVVMLDNGRVTAEGPLLEMMSRIDLPLQNGDEAGVVLEATIEEIDTQWHLARAAFAGGSLWLRDHGMRVGDKLRLRILARDVSVALSRHDDVSLLNLLPATVAALATDKHPGSVLLKLEVGATPFLARLTARSTDALQLVPGKSVWAQIKSVAVLE